MLINVNFLVINKKKKKMQTPTIHPFTHPSNECIEMLKLVKKLLYGHDISKKVKKTCRIIINR